MKTTHLLFIAVIITATSFTQQASANIWRVNNKSNYNGNTLWGDNFGGTISYPVFAQINQAVSVAASGDTVYVEASPLVYASAAIDRKLIIIGSGFFLSQNPHVSSTTDSSSIGQMAFNVGSEGSQVIGMSNVNSGSNPSFYITANDVTIKRCSLVNPIQVGNNLSDIYILENFFTLSGFSNAIAAYGNSYVYPTDLVFNNNICRKTLIWGGSIRQCNNNVFDGLASVEKNYLYLQFITDDFKNNILKPVNATVNINNGSNLNVSHNIGTNTTQFGMSNNNLVVPAINTLFVSSASPDGAYQIADGSAADNSGSDGTDRGAFGGAAINDRYTLSGLAAIPVIYSISTPGATATNLPVTIQARTIK